MPLYEYRLLEKQKGCDYCRKGFDELQTLSDAPLAQCPQCGGKVERVICAPMVRLPKTNSELKHLGFKKLVKRDKGVYEDVTAQSGHNKIVDVNE